MVHFPFDIRRSTLSAAGLALGLLFLAMPARATVAVPRDFPELVGRAEQIVAGTVAAVTDERDEKGTPWTAVTLSDLTVLKGEVGATFTVRFYGGDSTEHIAGMPTFTPGERAVLFVAGNGHDVCPLVGLWQGRFRLRVDSTNGIEVVDDSDHLPVVARSGRRLVRAASSSSGTQSAMTLDALRQLVADELAHPTGPAPDPQ